MSFLRGFSVNAAAGVLTFALAFANQAYIARSLGTEGLGQFAIAVTSVTVAGIVFGEWLARGNSFHSGRESGPAGSVWRNTVIYSLAMLLVFLGAALALASVAADLLKPVQALLLAGMAAAVVAQKGFAGILQGRDRLTAYAVIPLLFIASYLGFNVIGLGLLQAGVTGVLTAWLCGACLAALLAAALSRARGPADRWLLQATATVGSRGALSATLIFLLFRSDIYLVEYYLGTEVLGVYVIAVVIAEMMQRGPNIAGAVLLPKVLRGVDDDHVMSLAVSRGVLGFSLLAALGVILVGSPLIRGVYGTPFAGAHVPLLWMLPGLVASGFGSVLNTKLAGRGYPPVTMWAPGAALSTNVGLNLVLIPRFGLVGAALSTSIAYSLWAAIVTVAYQRITGLAWGRFLRVSE
ncbi:MAG: polysaccharide biosynthesis C-terminal domain-containing protein [Candidatus Latescibacterota bacterium]|nr:polysaccharide biosynthesis C-terminal domain-containing protein [Candidatus Latescibacterota bacterium]